VVVLNKWSYEAQGPTSSLDGMSITAQTKEKYTQHRRRGTFWRRIRFGLAQSFNERYISTPWQVKNVPPFDSRYPDCVPTRQNFLRQSAITVGICVFLLDLLGLFASDTSENKVNFARERVGFFSRLHNISSEEYAIRTVSTLIWWIAANWILQVLYYSLAFGTVLFNVTSPNLWPPLFGSLRDLLSVRQFWG
jgi:hypothetical protein